MGTILILPISLFLAWLAFIVSLTQTLVIREVSQLKDRACPWESVLTVSRYRRTQSTVGGTIPEQAVSDCVRMLSVSLRGSYQAALLHGSHSQVPSPISPDTDCDLEV